MMRINTATKAVDLFGAGKHGFTDGNPVGGIPSTDLNALMFNHLQEQLCRFIEAQGIVLDENNYDQFTAAIAAYVAGNGTPDATEAVKGKAELATQGETDAGADDARIVTPLKFNTSLIGVARTFNKPQRAAVGAIAFAASQTLDFGAYQDFVIGAANASFTLNNPSNQVAGQAGIIYTQQDATGGRTWAFGTHFDFGVDGVPDLNTAPNGWTKVQYHVRAANTVGGITATVLV